MVKYNEPLIVYQFFTIIVLIISLISPWQTIKFIVEEITNNNKINITTTKEILHSIYHKSTIYLEKDLESTKAASNYEYFDTIKIIFFLVLAFTIIIILMYIVVTKSLIDKSAPLSFELAAHSLPIIIIILTIALSFIASDLQVNICSNKFYYDSRNTNITSTPIKLSTKFTCFDLDIKSNTIILQPVSTPNYPIISTISSKPILGYYLILFSVINSIILSFIHIVRYDNLKTSNRNKTNQQYELLQTYI